VNETEVASTQAAIADRGVDQVLAEVEKKQGEPKKAEKRKRSVMPAGMSNPETQRWIREHGDDD